MQVIKKTLGTSWVDFDTFIETTASGTYRIYNRGNDGILLLEAGSSPAAGSNDGEPLMMNEKARYEKGTSTLYMRAINDKAVINVVEVEADA